MIACDMFRFYLDLGSFVAQPERVNGYAKNGRLIPTAKTGKEIKQQ